MHVVLLCSVCPSGVSTMSVSYCNHSIVFEGITMRCMILKLEMTKPFNRSPLGASGKKNANRGHALQGWGKEGYVKYSRRYGGLSYRSSCGVSAL